MSSTSSNHGLKDGQEYTLKIGTSFQPNKAKESYHLLRYDFKPASVDTSRDAEVHIGSNHECTVTIPNVHDAGTTTYKGGRRPGQKECILIIDKDTGEITLERISSNIQLKKSRVERSSEINAAKRAEMKSAVEKNNTPSLKAKGKPSQSSSSISSTTTNSLTTNSSSASSTSVPATQNSNSHISQPAVSNQAKQTPPVQHVHQQPQSIKKREKMLSMSTSDSNSSSSESSDSDSGPENEVDKKTDNTSTKVQEQSSSINSRVASYQIPKSTPASNNGQFMSTLHHDLHLSDSNESDSD